MLKLNMKKTTRQSLVTYAIVIIAFVVFQLLSSFGALSNLIEGQLVNLCLYAILAVSLNLVVGISGELSLGHAGFMCIGAFTSAFFSKICTDTIGNDFLRFLIAMVIGTFFAALVGFLIAIPVLRLRGDYLAIVTLAFGQIIMTLINSMYVGIDKNGLHISFSSESALHLEPGTSPIINGSQGITGTPSIDSDYRFFVSILFLLLTLAVSYHFINSRTGRAVMSIRDNRIAAESVGLNVTKYKILTFTIASAFAGLAGAIFSHNIPTLVATTKNFGYDKSIMILVFVVLGGIGSVRGSMIAAALLTLLPELLRSLTFLPDGIRTFVSENRMLIYAVILIVVMIFSNSPRFVEIRARLKAFFRRGTKKEAV